MAKGEIFVGRKEELVEFARVLERPEGEAVLVVVTGWAGLAILRADICTRGEGQ